MGFWDRLNAHQYSYVTRADRRVQGLVAEWVGGWVGGRRNGWMGGQRDDDEEGKGGVWV